MHACLPSSCSCGQQALHRMCHVIIHHQGPINVERAMLSKQTFPPVRGKTTNVVCLRVHARLYVRGMSLCIRPCLCEAGGGMNRSARERRWANFCVCMKPTTCLRGIFSIVFQHLQQGLFLIRCNICSSHVFPNYLYMHRHGDAHAKYANNKYTHYSIQLITPEGSPSWDLDFPSNKSFSIATSQKSVLCLSRCTHHTHAHALWMCVHCMFV